MGRSLTEDERESDRPLATDPRVGSTVGLEYISAPGQDHPEPERTKGAQDPSRNRPVGMLRNALAGSVWTMVSRFTGLGESITVGAVLGATYLGNTYQAVNSLPNLIYYQLLAGSLFASLLVPPLVAHVDKGDTRGAERLVGGFLGRVLLVAFAISGLILLGGHFVVRLLTLGVTNPATVSAQNRVGWILLVMFVPQITLYAIAGTWGAVQNAHGRFALAAGAPTLENLGIITVLLTAGAAFGLGTSIGHVSTPQLLLLGLGTTSAVGSHATCQWWGARRSSRLRFTPLAGWRDPEVLQVIRRIPPTLAYTGMAAAQILAILVVANRLAGGLVAFQLALNFFYLPAAVVTWPIARALLPELARFHRDRDEAAYRNEFVRGVTLASFITLPTAVAYATLSLPMARAIAFGQLATPRGIGLVALSLATLAPGVVGETWFILGTYAFYARQDVRSPLRSMGVRVVVTVSLMLAAWLAHGSHVLVLLGLSVSGGSLAGAAHISWRLRATLPRGNQALIRPLLRTLASSLVMAVPAYAATLAVSHLAHRHLASIGAMLIGVLVGLAVFVGTQAALRAPELAWLTAEVRQLRSRR